MRLSIQIQAPVTNPTIEHTAANIRRFAAKSHHLQADSPSVSLRYQRKFIKYERELLRCREDTQALSRFVNAQVVAFRKILKKYRVCFCLG